MERNDNIIKFRKKPFYKDLGIIIFVVIAFYILISVILYFKSDPIKGYEVKEGSLSVANNYTGFIIRKEDVITSNDAGYINFYAREGEKVACNDLLYSIDGTGKLNDLFNSDSNTEQTLSEDELKEIKSDIIKFAKDFDKNNFMNVYDFKYNLQGSALKISNLKILNNIEGLSSGLSASGIKLNYSPRSGYVVYNIDGYETLSANDVTYDLLSKDKEYEKKPTINNTLVAGGDNIYKYITDENWQIVIKVDEEKAQMLEEEEYVKIKFLKTGDCSNARTEILRNGDELFCILNLNNSVVSYCTDRYLDIELDFDKDTGLKIPISSIAEREFYLIPQEYAISVDENMDIGTFIKESYMEDGTLTTQKVELTIYNADDNDYYIDDETLTMGCNFVKTDSDSKYSLSRKAKLIGVYNINKGYADFRQIIKLYENEEYAIVKSNTNYGLSCYDYIVLDASNVKDQEFVYD